MKTIGHTSQVTRTPQAIHAWHARLHEEHASRGRTGTHTTRKAAQARGCSMQERKHHARQPP
eukprot:3692784-Alexandrium_andersonii.AAC.1